MHSTDRYPLTVCWVLLKDKKHTAMHKYNWELSEDYVIMLDIILVWILYGIITGCISGIRKKTYLSTLGLCLVWCDVQVCQYKEWVLLLTHTHTNPNSFIVEQNLPGYWLKAVSLKKQKSNKHKPIRRQTKRYNGFYFILLSITRQAICSGTH